MARNMLAWGSAWLGEQLKTHAADAVTLTRNGVTTTVVAVIGRTAFRNDQDGAASLQFSDRDYLIAVADYGYSEPAIGDKFTETINGVSVVHKVIKPDNGEPAWRWSDPQQTTWRIHTKRVS